MASKSVDILLMKKLSPVSILIDCGSMTAAKIEVPVPIT